MLRDFDPLLGWAIMTMASVAKIVVPMLPVGEFVRTLGLRLVRTLVMSPRGEIFGLPTEPLV
jgi:hypothetical protein